MDVPWQGFPSASERHDRAESLPAGLPRRGAAADHAAHPAPLPCHASPGSGSRHPNDPSLAGSSSDRDHGPVHPRELGGSTAGGRPPPPPPPPPARHPPPPPPLSGGKGGGSVWNRVFGALAAVPARAANAPV